MNRAIGRETDGDLTKFVNQTKKPFDNGQKWRAFKNISRAWKNPIGYMYWKTDVFAKNNRIRFMYLNLAYMLWHSIAITMMCKSTKTSMIAHWRYQTGMINDEYVTQQPKTMPYDRHKNYLRYSNFHQIRRNKRLGMIHLNWWCRDQNFRKYFEMRKKHDIRPSAKGFYHEAIQEESNRKNVALRDLRHSRQGK